MLRPKHPVLHLKRLAIDPGSLREIALNRKHGGKIVGRPQGVRVLRSEHAVEPGDRLPGALFTFDFVIEAPVTDASGAVTGMRRVAFEIGGARGLREHERQLRRDASALASGATDAIYRLRGSDLLDHMEDVLYLVAQWDPELFSRRGQINLKTLASPEARARPAAHLRHTQADTCRRRREGRRSVCQSVGIKYKVQSTKYKV